MEFHGRGLKPEGLEGALARLGNEKGKRKLIAIDIDIDIDIDFPKS
jgi:hypothetical protein